MQDECSKIDWLDWQAPMPATLMFIQKEGKVLLIRKKRGLGAGKINGPGGKIDPGESALECVIRECQEELCITPKDIEKRGELCFVMSDHPDIFCHVFIAKDFEGIPSSTDEADPIWFDEKSLPFNEMWEDDQYWLSEMLGGESFLGRFIFKGEKLLNYELLWGKEGKSQWLGMA